MGATLANGWGKSDYFFFWSRLPPEKIVRDFLQAGKKEGGLGGRNFCPPAKAKPRRSARLSAEPSRKFFFSFYLPAETSARAGKKKNGGARKLKNVEKIFLRGRPPSSAAGGGALFFSGIFDKISSSVVVNILHDKTF